MQYSLKPTSTIIFYYALTYFKLDSTQKHSYNNKQKLFCFTHSGDKAETDIKHNILPRHEVVSKLRDRGEPILLFGESELEAFKRLRKSELEPKINRVRLKNVNLSICMSLVF